MKCKYKRIPREMVKGASLENVRLAPALRAADENSTSSKMVGRVKKVTRISTRRYFLQSSASIPIYEV